MAFTSQDFPQKSFRIKPDDEKFLTKLLTKESSKSNPSFRVYYGDVPSAVPFTWETRPGTPKIGDFRENVDVPPLTPPPSYYANANLNASSKKNSKSNFFMQTLLRRINRRKSSRLASSPSSSSFSFSSFHDQVPPSKYRRRRFSSWGGERAGDKGFVIGKNNDAEKKRFHGYNSSVYVVKKVFLAIVGLRSTS